MEQKLKAIFEKFENGITYQQFSTEIKSAGIKLADLSTGDYVSKQKYTDDIETKDKIISQLNTDIGTRDTDLTRLQEQLQNAGADTEKLNTISSDLATLQKKYDNDTKNYQKQLSAQAYEFAVKEFANTKQFTSQAAKRDFVSSMLAKQLQMDNGVIMGAEDFANMYLSNNADAFKVETPPSNDNVPQQNVSMNKPQFVLPANNTGTNNGTGLGEFNFNFAGVRPIPGK